MIINNGGSPKDSLYYIGALILMILEKEKNGILVDELLKKAKESNINLSLFYYTLDWLFILSSIEIKNGKVKKI